MWGSNKGRTSRWVLAPGGFAGPSLDAYYQDDREGPAGTPAFAGAAVVPASTIFGGLARHLDRGKKVSHPPPPPPAPTPPHPTTPPNPHRRRPVGGGRGPTGGYIADTGLRAETGHGRRRLQDVELAPGWAGFSGRRMWLGREATSAGTPHPDGCNPSREAVGGLRCGGKRERGARPAGGSGRRLR